MNKIIFILTQKGGNVKPAALLFLFVNAKRGNRGTDVFQLLLAHF